MTTSAPDMTREISTAAAKAAPPTLVAIAAKLGALTLTDWVAIVTIGYVLMQAAYLVWRWVREWRAAKRVRKAGE